MCAGHVPPPPFPSNNYLLCSDHKSSQTLLIHSTGPSSYYRAVALIKLNGAECGSPHSLGAGASGEPVGSWSPPPPHFPVSSVTCIDSLNQRLWEGLRFTGHCAQRGHDSTPDSPSLFKSNTCFK